MGVRKLCLEYALCTLLAYSLSLVSERLGRTLSTSETLLLAYALTYATSPSARDGNPSLWLQRLSIWRWLTAKFSGRIETEEPLDHSKLHIFAAFPHGACTAGHLLTGTDGCGMLSRVFRGPRRDLAASVLFRVPLLRELVLLLGNVDAGSATAHYNLKRERSLLIFVGGEKEQLMTKSGETRVVLAERKGFVKLALQYGARLVPTYCFGENEVFETSGALMPLRSFLQRRLRIGISLVWPVPRAVPLVIEMGRPIEVPRMERADIQQCHIDELHDRFVQEMVRLFERTKAAHGVPAEQTLEVL